MSKKWLAAGLLPWAVFAQNSTDSTEITVYNRVKQPKATVLAPVEVITKADIERRQPKSVVELLSALPGIQFGTQTGGLGHQTSLFTRGTESDHTLILINGRPIAQSVSGSVDWSQFPVSGIQRVEYIRGPRAAIYGSNAIGGVVNLITTSDANEALVSATAGSNDYYEGNLSVNQWVGEDTHLQLAGGYRETRGYDIRPTEQQPDSDGFEQFNGQLGLTHNIDDNWTADVSLMGWNNKSEFDYTKAFDFGSSANESERQTYQTDAALSYSDERIYTRFDAGYGETELKTWRDTMGKSTAANLSTAITRLGGLGQFKYSQNGYLLSGVDWQQERLLSKSRTSFGQTFDAPNRDNTGVYASVFHTWSPVSIELTGRIDDNEQFGSHGTWQSAVSLALPYAHKSTLSYGTAYRAPSFNDLYFPGFSNPDLKPEESENWELSVSGDYDLFSWELNIYRNEIDNLVIFDGGVINSSRNTDALIKGTEFVVKTTTGSVNHTASYEYTDAEDTANGKRQLARRAKRKFSWTGDIDVANANLFAQALYVGERNDSSFSNVVLPSYTIWNIGARYPLTKQLTLNGKINNLFDKQYQVVDSYDAPDMEFYVGADYRF